MNQKARSLGMHSSNFLNPHGLTASGQYSTARDMSKLARVAYFHRTIRSITSLKNYPSDLLMVKEKHLTTRINFYQNPLTATDSKLGIQEQAEIAL